MQWFDVLGPRRGLLLLAVAAFGLVGAGLVIQEVARLNPCPLCIFQRLLYLLFGAVALLGALLPRGHKPLGLGLAALCLAGFGTAAYQTVMQAFPEVVSECNYSDPGPIELLVDWLGMQYPPLFMATGFCASRDWLFLNLSMANWSLLCFGGFGAAALLVCGWFRRRRSY